MFNAANAKTTVKAVIDADSDLFAAELEDRFATMSITEQQALMRKLREVVADPAAALAFAKGTYAQNNQGQPAAALGTGTTGTATPTQGDVQAALATLRNAATGIGPDQLALVARALAQPNDPGFIKAGQGGMPQQVIDLRQEVVGLKSERDHLREDRGLLDWVVDKLNHHAPASSDYYGVASWKASLQPALDAVRGVSKPALSRLAAAAKAKVESITGGALPGAVNGKEAAVKAIEAIEQMAS